MCIQTSCILVISRTEELLLAISLAPLNVVEVCMP